MQATVLSRCPLDMAVSFARQKSKARCKDSIVMCNLRVACSVLVADLGLQHPSL